MEIDRDLIRQAAGKLSSAGIESADHDAAVLLEYSSTTAQFNDLIAQRAKRIPLQHLTGCAHFRYITLAVGSGVFIPRPETELLAQVGIDVLQEKVALQVQNPPQLSAEDSEKLLAKLDVVSEPHLNGDETLRQKPIAFDLCSGSGAIALSLATEVSHVTVHAVEISSEATEWLLTNVSRHSDELDAKNSRVTVHTLDATDEALFLQWSACADVVISNPPYIPNHMIPRDPEVRDYDPHLALFGGVDGLNIPLRVARVAALLLKDGGTFAMEHADVQGEHESGLPNALRQMKDVSGDPLWLDVNDHTDYNGLPRFTTALRAPRQSEVQG